jgi:PST family polysaccharide transporter
MSVEVTTSRPRAVRRIMDNAMSLFALQGLTYLVSFMTVPYLLRVLGAGNFGSIAFANTVMAQFILLTDFGFGSSATRLAAIHSEDQRKLNKLFSAVMGVKFLLLLASFVVVCILAFCFERFRADRVILGIAFLQVIGTVLFPSWLFQGLQRMRLISGISIAARLCSAVLIFLLVHGPSDSGLAMACQSGGVLLQGALALGFAIFVLRIRYERPQLDQMWYQVKDSFHPFLGASMGNIVGGSSVLFLGIFKDMVTVGNYAAIERTARAEVMAMLPISQAAYPHISQRFNESLASGNRAMRKLCAYLLGGALIFVSAIAVFSKQILHLLYGNRLLLQAHLFSAFSAWSYLSLLNTLLGLHYLIASGHAKEYGRSVFWSALTTVVLFVTLIPIIRSWGALIAVVAGELVQTVLMVRTIVSINRMAAVGVDAEFVS